MQLENTQNILFVGFTHFAASFFFFPNQVIHIATTLGFLSCFNFSIVYLFLTLLFTAYEKSEVGVAHTVDTLSTLWSASVFIHAQEEVLLLKEVSKETQKQIKQAIQMLILMNG